MSKCQYCGGDIEIRNPTGKCDHLYYPDNVNKGLKPMTNPLEQRIAEIISWNKPRHSLEIEDEERIPQAITKELEKDLEPLREVWKKWNKNNDAEKFIIYPEVLVKESWQAIQKLAEARGWE